MTQALHLCWGTGEFSVCFPGSACEVLLHRQDDPLKVAREARLEEGIWELLGKASDDTGKLTSCGGNR